MAWSPTSPDNISVRGADVSQDIDRMRLSYDHVARADDTHEIVVVVEEGYDSSGFVYVRNRTGFPYTVPASDVTTLLASTEAGSLCDRFETELWTVLADNGMIPAGAEA